MPSSPHIAVLPPILVNKIAAGEVVERPASVLKELLENAIDAGATQILVDIEKGGIQMIRVSDNGCGIHSEELELAFTPHATSKVRRDEDLAAIRSMGFRGEALASIASISRVELISRPTDSIEGARLRIEGGQWEQPRPEAAPPGTTISVQDLFYNTPARRKFLKTPNTEMSHLTERFTRIALAHTGLRFRLTHNGRTVHDLPPEQSLRERIGLLFGSEMAESLIQSRRVAQDITIDALIGPPQLSRPNAQSQYLFVNGRFIKDRTVSHAVREAYRGLIEPQRHAVAFLFITVPHDQVDVNVHPAKTEVRFANAQSIHGHVLATLRDKLLRSDLSASMDTRRMTAQQAMHEPQPRNRPETAPSPAHPNRPDNTQQGNDLRTSPIPAEQPEANQPGTSQPATESATTQDGAADSLTPHQQRVQQAVAEFFKSHPGSQSGTLPFDPKKARRNFYDSPSRSSQPGNPPPPSSQQHKPQPHQPHQPTSRPPAGSMDAPADNSADTTITPLSDPESPRPADAGIPSTEPPVSPPSTVEPPETPRAESSSPLPLVQLLNSYILTESENGDILIIDQHALHERILYEELLSHMTEGPIAVQHCLIPETLEVSPHQMTAMESYQELLTELGVHLSSFGPTSIAVQAYPAMLTRLNPTAFVKDLLDILAEEGDHLEKEALVHSIFETIACKAAIKAGDPLSESEMRDLLTRAEVVDRHSNCPHGRPTTIRLTRRELDRQFKRT